MILDHLEELPEPRQSLMTAMDGRAKDFQQNIRHWNNVFSFASIHSIWMIAQPPREVVLKSFKSMASFIISMVH